MLLDETRITKHQWRGKAFFDEDEPILLTSVSAGTRKIILSHRV